MFHKCITYLLKPTQITTICRGSWHNRKMSSVPKFETLSVDSPKPYVYHVQLNRPEQLNAMNDCLWREIGICFNWLGDHDDCRSIVLSGNGKIFCAGLDFKDFMRMGQEIAEQEDVARKAKLLSRLIKRYQQSMTSLELCKKPVLAAVHSACIGGAVNLITAADMRYCTQDAWFQIKEVDLGLAADVGVLQRLPRIIKSDSLARELSYTARKLEANEAFTCGLVLKIFPDKDSMLLNVLTVAEEIAKKSPVAVQGTKLALVYGRDHSVQEGLDQMAWWNQLMLQSEDFANATMGQISKQKDIVFSKL